jgi:hypothetical protein
VAFIADAFTHVVLSCLSASPAAFPALFHEVSVPGGLPPITFPTFFSTVLPALPPGPYVVFVAAAPPEAFVDGTIDPADLLAVAGAGFTVVP